MFLIGLLDIDADVKIHNQALAHFLRAQEDGASGKAAHQSRENDRSGVVPKGVSLSISFPDVQWTRPPP